MGIARQMVERFLDSYPGFGNRASFQRVSPSGRGARSATLRPVPESDPNTWP